MNKGETMFDFKMLDGRFYKLEKISIDHRGNFKDMPLLLTFDTGERYKICRVTWNGYSVKKHKRFIKARRLPKIYEICNCDGGAYVLCEYIEGRPLSSKDLQSQEIRAKVIKMIDELNEDGLCACIDQMDEMILANDGKVYWIDLDDLYVAPNGFKQQYVTSISFIKIGPDLEGKGYIEYVDLRTGKVIE
jgi:hypothetical protein